MFPPGEIGRRGQRSQALVVLDVDGGAALDGHVEHVDVVVHHHDVSDRATVCVLSQSQHKPQDQPRYNFSNLEVKIAAFGQNKAIDLLLVEHRGKVHRVFAPRDIA